MTKPELTYYDLPAGAVAFSTTRKGGQSEGNYASFNINEYCGDNPDAICANREALAKEIEIPTDRFVLPHQVHGMELRIIAPEFFDLPDEIKRMLLEGVDGVLTSMNGVCVGVSTADCIPILLYDPVHQAVAAVHAGWRGTLQRIVLKAVAEMKVAYLSNPEDLYAVVGPGISLAQFEVGDEVYEQFLQAGFNMETISKRTNKWHIDLPECNRMQLIQTGVAENRIHMSGICTYSQSDEYFSARCLGVDSGRIYTGILLK